LSYAPGSQYTLYPQPLYTASQVRTTSRSWDKGVLSDLCLTLYYNNDTVRHTIYCYFSTRLVNLPTITGVALCHKNNGHQRLTSSVRRIKHGSCSLGCLDVILTLFHVFLIHGLKLNTSLRYELV